VKKMAECKDCPYYEQKTSYGTEMIICMNVTCEYRKEKEYKQTGEVGDD